RAAPCRVSLERICGSLPARDVSETIWSIARNRRSRTRFSEYKSSFRRQSHIWRERLNRADVSAVGAADGAVESISPDMTATEGASQMPRMRFSEQIC